MHNLHPMDDAKNTTQDYHEDQVRKTLVRPKQDHNVKYLDGQRKEGQRTTSSCLLLSLINKYKILYKQTTHSKTTCWKSMANKKNEKDRTSTMA